jgi:hypothetical protein
MELFKKPSLMLVGITTSIVSKEEAENFFPSFVETLATFKESVIRNSNFFVKLSNFFDRLMKNKVTFKSYYISRLTKITGKPKSDVAEKSTSIISSYFFY